MKRWNDFMEDESGMGVVEIILIMVVSGKQYLELHKQECEEDLLMMTERRTYGK